MRKKQTSILIKEILLGHFLCLICVDWRRKNPCFLKLQSPNGGQLQQTAVKLEAALYRTDKSIFKAAPQNCRNIKMNKIHYYT